MSEGYEKKDVSIKAIALGTFATVAIIIIFIFFIRDYFLLSVDKAVQAEALNNPNPELIEIDEKDKALLAGYGILDKEKGIYKIPIDEAMKIIVSEYNNGKNN